MLKKLAYIGLPLLVLVALYWAYQTTTANRAQGPVAVAATKGEGRGSLPVYTHRVIPQLLQERVTATGTVLAEEAVDLTSEVSGKVISLNFEEGTRVTANQLLLKINDDTLQAELARTLHRIELAKLQAGRQRQLLEARGTSQDAYDAALNEQRVLEAEAELIRAQLDKTEIRAPFDGLVGLRYVSAGSYLTPSTRVASLQDITTLKIEFSIAERHMNRLQPGGEVTVIVAGLPDPFTATIYALEPRIDLATRTIRVRARATNPDERVLPGAFATVDVPLEEIPDALLVPATAIIPGLREQTLYVIEAGQAQPRIIQTGLRLDRDVQILSGLQPGDTVITSGQLQLRPGMAVEAIERPAESSAAGA